MSRYFYLEKGAVKGPIERDEFLKLIETKKIAGLDLVYREPEKEWKPLLEYPEFASWIEGQKPSPEEPKSLEWILLQVLDRSMKPYVTKQSGPFGSALIQKMLNRGEIEFTDYLWTEGYSKWKKIAEIVEFSSQKERIRFSAESPVVDLKTIEEIPVESLLADVKVEARVIPDDLIPEEALVEPNPPQEEPAKITPSVTTTSPLVKHREESKKKPVVNSPPPLWAGGSSEETLRFRMMQGVFAAFLMGSILGITIYLSHPSEFVKGLKTIIPLGDTQPPVVLRPPSEPPMERTPVRPKEPVASPAPTPVTTQSPAKAEVPAPAPRVFATRVKLRGQDLAGQNPAFIIETDASRHAQALLRLVGKSGQILDRRTYQRDWVFSFQKGQEKLVPLKSFRLGDGWYTLSLELDGKKSSATFFLGQKTHFKTKMRKHRKNLAFVHQKEKEELFKIQLELAQLVSQLQKSPQASVQDLNQINRLLSLVNQRSKVKNDLLWPEEWQEMGDILSNIKSTQKAVSSSQIQQLRSRIQGLQI